MQAVHLHPEHTAFLKGYTSYTYSQPANHLAVGRTIFNHVQLQSNTESVAVQVHLATLTFTSVFARFMS